MNEIKHLNYNMRQVNTLKMQMAYSISNEIRQQQKEDTMKWIIDDFKQPEVTK